MRSFAAIVVGTALLVGLGALVVFRGPSPTTAASAPTPADAAAGTAPPSVALRSIGTFDQPVYVTSPPGDSSRLFVVEKTGRIRIVKNGSVLATPFLDISGLVSNGGEQGLLSMAFDPRFATNRRFYVDYTDVNGDTRVVGYRASRADPDVAVPGSARVLLRVDQPYANHNGGQLQFGPNGMLFVGMGDGGGGGDPQHRAQDPRSRLGKLLRLNVNVSPVRVRTYAKGLRNPWRFSFDRKTGALWIGDVGQDAWEEIDYLRPGRPAGANLGWNGYEGTHVYDAQVAATLDKAALTWPVAQYSHSLGESVTGGYVYRGSAIPALRGFYLFADFVSGHVWAKKGPGGARRALSGADGQVAQVSSFGQDARGELYVVSLAGPVFRIVPR
jgi:glucose/arabinose dehydrogenase